MAHRTPPGKVILVEEEREKKRKNKRLLTCTVHGNDRVPSKSTGVFENHRSAKRSPIDI